MLASCSATRLICKRPLVFSRTKHIAPLQAIEWRQHRQNSSDSSKGTVKWIRNRVYGAILVVGVTSGGLIMVRK